jgi:hypothetical protein
MLSNLCENIPNCASFDGGRTQQANVLKKNYDGMYNGMN